MNVCFELKLAVQVLLQRAAAGQRQQLSGEHPGICREGTGKALRERKAQPLCRERAGKRGRVQSGREGRRETLQDIYAIALASCLRFVRIDFLLFTQRLGLALSSSWSGSAGDSIVL